MHTPASTHPGRAGKPVPACSTCSKIRLVQLSPLAVAVGGLGSKGSVADHVQRASHRHAGVIAHLRQRNQAQVAASQLGFGGPRPGLAAVCCGRPRQRQESLQAGRQAVRGVRQIQQSAWQEGHLSSLWQMHKAAAAAAAAATKGASAPSRYLATPTGRCRGTARAPAGRRAAPPPTAQRRLTARLRGPQHPA